MIRSMTGYGAATVESPALRAAVSVRSLNHRYLELVVHAPRRLQSLEPEVKRRVQARLNRGRVEVVYQAVVTEEAGEAAVVVAHPVVAGVVRALREIRTQHDLAGEIRVSDVARFPGALEARDTAVGVEGEVAQRLLALLDQALDGLDGMRRAEGEHLAGVLTAGLDAVETAAGRIHELSEAGKAARRETLVERVRALGAELGLDEARVYQEVVRAVERHDVAEEVERLKSHVGQARELLRTAGPCGRPLDFLAQEMAREANTVGSKASSGSVAREVVALKSEIEKLREQVQNVE
jgi:uncharacterized protein (TIGR00255 family)